jgi:hypothetical protein
LSAAAALASDPQCTPFKAQYLLQRTTLKEAAEWTHDFRGNRYLRNSATEHKLCEA